MRLERAKSEEWLRSADFKRLCHKLNAICVSFERVKEEISPEDKELLSRVLEIIGHGSPRIVEFACMHPNSFSVLIDLEQTQAMFPYNI